MLTVLVAYSFSFLVSVFNSQQIDTKSLGKGSGQFCSPLKQWNKALSEGLLGGDRRRGPGCLHLGCTGSQPSMSTNFRVPIRMDYVETSHHTRALRVRKVKVKWRNLSIVLVNLYHW